LRTAAKLVCVLILVGGSALAGVPDAVDPADIPAYRVLRPGLAVGGQPSPAAVSRLADMGFRTVINLRTASEGAEAEGDTVREEGLRYVWVPVTPAGFTLDDVRAVEAVLEDPQSGPVLLHCASSNRVGGVWAVIQALRGASLADAESAGHQAGLHSPAMLEAVRRVLGAPGDPPNP